jgi:hypothetical protein
MNDLVETSLKWKVNQNTTTQNTGQQYMSYLSSDEKQNLGLHFFSKVPLQFFGEAKGLNLVEPAQSILIFFGIGFYGSCEQVYGLSDLAEPACDGA